MAGLSRQTVCSCGMAPRATQRFITCTTVTAKRRAENISYQVVSPMETPDACSYIVRCSGRSGSPASRASPDPSCIQRSNMSHQPTSSSRGPTAAPSKSVMQATSKFCQIMLPGRESPHERTSAVSGGSSACNHESVSSNKGSSVPPAPPAGCPPTPRVGVPAPGRTPRGVQRRQARIVDVGFMDPGQGPQSFCHELGTFGRRGIDEESAPGVRGVLARYVPGDVAHDEEGRAQDLRHRFRARGCRPPEPDRPAGARPSPSAARRPRSFVPADWAG